MLTECNNHPNLNHESCELDQHEVAVAAFFESRGFVVERLCTRWLPEGVLSPDFKVLEDGKVKFLCEVKHVLSSTAAIPETDWRYNNKEEYERLTQVSRNEGIPLVALPDQIALWKGEIPYPAEGRNTKQREQEYERKIRDALRKLPIANQPLSVTIHRHDPFIWRDEEIENFVQDLAEKLELIAADQISQAWFCDFGVYKWEYRQPRDNGRFIQNSVDIRQEGAKLVVQSISYLGINWLKIEKDCREAQKQIRYRLELEHERQSIARLAVLFIEEDLVFEYIGKCNELRSAVQRHVQTKSPELSAIAFCSNSDAVDPGNLRFTVFHTGQQAVPKLTKSVFDNGMSHQIDV